MKALLENSKVMTGADNYPKTMIAAYNMAAEFRVPVHAEGGHSMNLVTAGSMSASAASKAAFATNVSKASKKKKQAKSGQPKSREGSSKPQEEKSGETKTVTCWACGEPGHKLSNCPKIEANKRIQQGKTSKALTFTIRFPFSI